MLIGTTRRGTVVRLDRRFVEADLRIATGLVEPHFMAGWSGGRKVIAPGVAHAETITTFHSARFMEHPNCTNCVLEGNPLHEEQLEIMAMIAVLAPPTASSTTSAMWPSSTTARSWRATKRRSASPRGSLPFPWASGSRPC